MKTVLAIVLLILNINASANSLSIEEHLYHIDNNINLILINEDLNGINSNNISSIILGEAVYTFGSTISQLQIGKSYTVSSPTNEMFTLYFTQLPIVSLHTTSVIVDEPRVYARLRLCKEGSSCIEHDIGIEIRGGSSKSYPKKSFRIEFLEDTINDKTLDVSLLGMRNDDDWNLQAMYNEPLRLRSKVNFELWERIANLYYMQQEPNANNSVEQEYVELFLNDEYQGIYTLSERIDRKQLKLKKYKDGEIRGELYKGVGWGASTYTSLPNYDNTNEFWSGFKYEYPSNVINWNNLYEYVDFIINDDSLGFYQKYTEYLCLENAVNYFIFLNTLRATDNTGKNLYLAKYNTNEPYFFVPWDLDGTFGMIWNGSQENITNDILTNGLYNRLLLDNASTGFTACLIERWKELRDSVISVNNVLSMFNSEFHYLNRNGVYEREQRVWAECPFLDLNNIDYTRSWLEARLDFLDMEWGDSSSFSNITNTEMSIQSLVVFPNPVYDHCKFKSDIEVIKISIFNDIGVLHKVIHPSDMTGEIDMRRFKSGFYIVVFDLITGVKEVKKVIVSH